MSADIRAFGDPHRHSAARWLAVVAGTIAVLAGLSVPFGYVPMLVVAFGLLIVAVILRPDFVTIGVAAVIYSNAASVAVHSHGVPVFLALLVPASLLIPFVFHLLVRRDQVRIPRATLFLLIFVLANTAAAAFAADPAVSAQPLFTLLTEGAAFYLIVVNVVRTPQMLRRVTWALVTTGAILGGLSLLQQVTGTFSNDYGGFAQIKSTRGFTTETDALVGDIRQLRLAGPIGDSNYYAQFLLMLIPLGIGLASSARDLFARTMAVASVLLGATGILLSFSRGAAVAFAILLFLMAATRFIRLRAIIAAAAVVVAVIVLFPQYAVRLQRLEAVAAAVAGETAEGDTAIAGRAEENAAAIMIFADHPILGAGPGMYQYHYRAYTTRAGLTTHAEDRLAHNMYLETAAETGLVGLAALLGMLMVVLIGLRRAARAVADTGVRPIIQAYFFALVAFMGTSVFLSLAYARYFWLVFALASAAWMISDEIRQPTPAGPRPARGGAPETPRSAASGIGASGP